MQPALKVFSPSLIVCVVCACICALYTHRKRDVKRKKFKFFHRISSTKKINKKVLLRDFSHFRQISNVKFWVKFWKFDGDDETAKIFHQCRIHSHYLKPFFPSVCCILGSKRLRAIFNGFLHDFSLIYSPFIQFYQLVGLFLLLGLHFKHLRIQLQHVIVLTSVAVTEKCSRCVFHGSHVWNDWRELTKRATCCRNKNLFGDSLSIFSHRTNTLTTFLLKYAIKRYKMYEKWLSLDCISELKERKFLYFNEREWFGWVGIDTREMNFF